MRNNKLATTVSSVNPMEMMKFNLERQNEQGEALVEIIKHVEGIESNVESKFAEMSYMVKEVRDSVTLTYEEQKELQQKVFKTSVEFAKDVAGESLVEIDKETFLKEVGKFRRSIWKKLKERMNVPRYTSIRRVDFEEALIFVSDLKMKDFLNI